MSDTDTDILRAVTYAASLRDLADAIADGQINPPRSPLRLYMGHWDDTDPKALFMAARRAFPTAPVVVDPDGYGHVELHISDVAKLLFDKKSLGTITTVARPVEEFTIDPALLADIAPLLPNTVGAEVDAVRR